MPRVITVKINVYTVDEACEQLAKLAKHRRPRYTRGGFYNIVRKYKPELTKTEFTELDLQDLANVIRKPGRRRRTIDKSE